MKMQRLHLLAMEEERQSLMDALLQFGRLEIRQTEDLAAEQKARVTYDNILRLSDDPDVSDVIKFLRAREIVHFQRFGEGLPPDGGGAVGAGQPGSEKDRAVCPPPPHQPESVSG